ncbi:PVC-type heme-binding CxxCH protein [Chryseolinea sp. H1M3-3]|uniref:PVC-type heme-binding CxxCH protein n=1 Tax=Chryseolinea sp. H1M3-3 TaxID=3034144 RepID=UPI0023EB85B2|nr:PVC-type heme-binding CxxCH protein [Chryseolinea sp. H1M3-3]
MFYSILRNIGLCCSLLCILSCSKPKTAEEHSAEASLADLTVHNGLEVSLFASEPMFSNPTNMAIDERGRVWVCEAFNYRNQYNPKNPVKAEGDRIMILEDTDGDGKADKSKVFYQGTDVNSALGISLVGNRIIISCSPNVFVFTDENGDDVPDKKEILFQGIQGVQHDHGMHTFVFGPEGRLYFNFGNEGKSLLNAAGDTVVDIHGHKVVTNGKPFRQGLVMRSDINGQNVEVLGSNFRNNYEVALDPYGTMWQSDNDDDGNKGTRINYVMEYGNYGYQDEMTGAGWRARRTNMEKEIPLRHWHLNDPGVVPNVLQTGAGSPAGLTLYEGNLLPEVFYGQMIHAEPGNNVVRSYPVENEGAGYKATIINILKSQKDQWFRPIDVAVAPDGSLFVADWYDPGVGGHQVGDVNRGRIYRVAPIKSKYTVPTIDVSTTDGAITALLNPNASSRILGWNALAAMGEKAEEALKKIWTSKNQRHRAQAFWLLIKLQGKADEYLSQALSDQDPNIRIAGIRAARFLEKNIPTVTAQLVKDPSPQVRRELAIALRGNSSKEAANLWTQLAQQYDGKDRWYLEALGISASGNWDLYFNTWKAAVGKNWNTPANIEIVWRSRSKSAMPLLADLIKSSDEKTMFKYYRAFDFHTDPSKQKVLADLLQQTEGSKVLYALKHMEPTKLRMTAPVKTALNKVLEEHRGKIEFVELVTSFKLQDRSGDLLQLALQYPDSTVGKESAKTLLDWNKVDLIQNALNSTNKDVVQAMIKSLWPHMYNAKAISLMEGVMMDSAKNIDLRKLAVKTFGGPWQAEDRLLVLAKESKIPSELHTAAGGVFQTAWRALLKEEAAKYLKIPGSKEGAPLPSVSVLVDKKGDQANGKTVFQSVCGNCHQVKGEGVNFGPDLSEIGSKLSKEALYTSILFPDQGISFGFEGYRLQLNDGSTAVGKIVSETADKVELQYMNNQQSVEKANVTSRTKLESSLMPSDLQSAMSEQDLIDLVSYLETLRKDERISKK